MRDDTQLSNQNLSTFLSRTSSFLIRIKSSQVTSYLTSTRLDLRFSKNEFDLTWVKNRWLAYLCPHAARCPLKVEIWTVQLFNLNSSFKLYIYKSTQLSLIMSAYHMISNIYEFPYTTQPNPIQVKTTVHFYIYILLFSWIYFLCLFLRASIWISMKLFL